MTETAEQARAIDAEEERIATPVPTGRHEADLHRVVTEVRDFKKGIAFALALLTFDIAIIVARIRQLEKRPAGMTEWDRRRVEELERTVHLHLHPEEYTHRDR